jgi:hypothetical protein
MSKSDQLKRIAFLLPDLSIGGAQRIAVNLLKGFENLNIPLDLVVASSEGLLAQEISSNIRLFNLNVQLDALRLKVTVPGSSITLKESGSQASLQ